MKKINEFLQAVNSIHGGKYRSDIDGLRAVAVLSVVICHAFPSWLPGGFAGVDIFFVISGYLISSILISDLEKESFSIVKFYERRVRRIFPALVVVLISAMLIGWLVLFSSEYRALGKHVVASSLFSENFLLWSEASYFDVSSEKKPLLHLWSLAIEEQFYIVWPLAMYLIHRGHIRFISLFLILGISSLSISVYLVYHDMTPAYYSPLSRGWELMVGACLAYLQKQKFDVLSKYRDGQSIAGALLVFGSIIFIRPEFKFPGFWAIAPTLGTFLLISAGEAAIFNRLFLSFRPMVWVGLISYPLYLWHWIFLSFNNILFTRSRLVICLLIAVSLIAAALTFIFVEMPFRNRKKNPNQPIILATLMVMVLLIGGLVGLQVIPSRLGKFDIPTKTEWDFLKNKFGNLDANPIGIFAVIEDRPQQVLFMGDSHLAQYASRIDKVANSNKNAMGAIFAVGGGCIPIPEVYSDDMNRAKCWPLRTRMYEMAKERKFSKLVIGGAWNWYFFSNEFSIISNGKKISLNSPDGRQQALFQLKESISLIVKSGKKVIFVLDNPLIDFTRLIGSSIRLQSPSPMRFNGNMQVIVPREQWRLREELAKLAVDAGASVIDPFNALCDELACRVTSPTGQLLYKDDGHFNPEWVVDHAEFIDETILLK